MPITLATDTEAVPRTARTGVRSTAYLLSRDSTSSSVAFMACGIVSGVLAAGSVGSKQSSSAAPLPSPISHRERLRFSFCLLLILCAWVSSYPLGHSRISLPIALSARG